MNLKLPYVWAMKDRHGQRRYYVRRKGHKLVPLPGEPGSRKFMAAYQGALGGEQETQGSKDRSSLRWLCDQYQRSAEFRGLNVRTQYVRKLIIDRLCREHGGKPFARLEPMYIRAMRDKRADRPEAANAFVRVLRAVFKWAVEAGHAKSNPAREVPMLRPTNPDGHHTWTLEEVEQYRANHPLGTKSRLALELLLFTGCRRSDVVTLGRHMVSDGWVTYTEAKGRDRRPKKREFPILPELQAVLEATTLTGARTWLVTERGHSYSAEGFGNWFRRQCRVAGLSHCSAHGLRKAGATFAAEAGATEHQLMAIYDWDSPKQAALYTRRANRRRLTGDAMHMLVARKKDGDEGILPLHERA